MMTDLSKQTDATDLDIISFFEIDPDCNKLFDALDARGTQYDDGCDVVFWIVGSYYLERLGANDWYVKDMRYIKADADDDIASHGIAAYHSDNTSVPKALSLFGLDHHAAKSLNIVGEDYNGLCQVWVQHYYYSGYNSTGEHSSWMADNELDLSPIVFDNAREAQIAINNAKSTPYGEGTAVLHHGESSPTDYYIAEV